MCFAMPHLKKKKIDLGIDLWGLFPQCLQLLNFAHLLVFFLMHDMEMVIYSIPYSIVITRKERECGRAL